MQSNSIISVFSVISVVFFFIFYHRDHRVHREMVNSDNKILPNFTEFFLSGASPP
jgi:hypothetical protein